MIGYFRRNPALLGVLSLIVLLTVIGCLFSKDFRSVQNFQNVFEQSAPLAFTALGQTVVIITRGIDLSIDAQIALLSSLASGIVDSDAQRAIPVVLGVLALGVIIGLYTLTPVGGIPDGYDFFGYGRILGVPVGMALAVVLFAIVGFVLTYTRLGRQIYAFGGDPRAATMAGLPTTRVILFTYCLMGLLTAVTAVFLVSRLGVGNPVADGGFNLGSITAVVIGGTMLTGGRGSVLGTLLGVFMVQLLNNLLNFLDVSTFYQWMIQGAIVIVAVSLYVERRRTRA